MEKNDAVAFFNLGCDYAHDQYRLHQDYVKVLELWHRAGELGCAIAYHNIGNAYMNGEGVQRDMKNAQHYWELAAMGGDIMARHNLGVLEEMEGNMNRALKHFMVSARGGLSDSLNAIQAFFKDGHATNKR